MNRLSRFLQAAAVVFTIVGVSATLVPYVVAIEADPLFKDAWDGYLDLARMDETDDSGKSVGILWKDDPGFHKIYGILQRIDPSVPDADCFPASVKKPAVYTYRTQTLTTSGEKIPLIVPVKVEVPDQQDRFVCLLPELRSTIVASRVTWWSRLGLAAAILGTLVAFASAARESSSVSKTSLHYMRELRAVAGRVTDLERRAIRNEVWPVDSAKQFVEHDHFGWGAGLAVGTVFLVAGASVILARLEVALKKAENRIAGT